MSLVLFVVFSSFACHNLEHLHSTPPPAWQEQISWLKPSCLMLKLWQLEKAFAASDGPRKNIRSELASNKSRRSMLTTVTCCRWSSFTVGARNHYGSISSSYPQQIWENLLLHSAIVKAPPPLRNARHDQNCSKPSSDRVSGDPLPRNCRCCSVTAGSEGKFVGGTTGDTRVTPLSPSFCFGPKLQSIHLMGLENPLSSIRPLLSFINPIEVIWACPIIADLFLHLPIPTATSTCLPHFCRKSLMLALSSTLNLDCVGDSTQSVLKYYSRYASSVQLVFWTRYASTVHQAKVLSYPLIALQHQSPSMILFLDRNGRGLYSCRVLISMFGWCGDSWNNCLSKIQRRCGISDLSDRGHHSSCGSTSLLWPCFYSLRNLQLVLSRGSSYEHILLLWLSPIRWSGNYGNRLALTSLLIPAAIPSDFKQACEFLWREHGVGFRASINLQSDLKGLSSSLVSLNGKILYSRSSRSCSWTAIVPQPRYQLSFCRGHKRLLFPPSFSKEKYVSPDLIWMVRFLSLIWKLDYVGDAAQLSSMYLSSIMAQSAYLTGFVRLKTKTPAYEPPYVLPRSVFPSLTPRTTRLAIRYLGSDGRGHHSCLVSISLGWFWVRRARILVRSCYMLILPNYSSKRMIQISSFWERSFSPLPTVEINFSPSSSSKEVVFQRSKTMMTWRANMYVHSPLVTEGLDFDFASIISETFWQKFPVSIIDDHRYSILNLLCNLVYVTNELASAWCPTCNRFNLV